MSNLARLPPPYLNTPFNSTFQASLKEYEGCYIGTKSPLRQPGFRRADGILATYCSLFYTQLPSTLPLGHVQLWGDTKQDCPIPYRGIPWPGSLCELDSAAVWECRLQGLVARVQGEGVVWLVPLETRAIASAEPQFPHP